MKLLTKRITRLAVGAVALGFLAVGPQGALAQEGEKPKYVGRVVDIDGPELKTNRLKEEKWYQAYETMPTFFEERLMANPKTTATLEFAVGGRAVISPGSKVIVHSQELLEVQSGTVWAKFDKAELAKKGKKFEIQTAGGVMGIEGTEFMVKTGPDGKTELVVIEGTVGVEGQQSVPAGQAASFNKTAYDVAGYALDATTPWGRRQAAYELLGVPSEARWVMNRALWRVGNRGYFGRHFYGRNYWMASTALYAIRNPKGAAISVVNRQTGGIGGGFLAKAWEPPKPVNSIVAKGATPTFSWDSSKGTSKYAVVVANDNQGEDVVWYGVTKGKETKITYPSYGPELAANKRYYIFVSSLDEEGKPRAYDGRSLSGDTSFSAQGHTPVYQAISGVVALGATGTPEVNWKTVKDANTYKVTFETTDGQSVVWTGDSSENTYKYPDTGRALEAGDYRVRVDAYDSGGLLMAESQPATFATAGWESVGLDGPAREARLDRAKAVAHRQAETLRLVQASIQKGTAWH
jgi:FecR protein